MKKMNKEEYGLVAVFLDSEGNQMTLHFMK